MHAVGSSDFTRLDAEDGVRALRFKAICDGGDRLAHLLSWLEVDMKE